MWYRDGANDCFNDWFLLNTELIQPSGKIVFKVGSVYSKVICIFNKQVRSRSLGLFFIMSLTLWLTWFFLLVDTFLDCSLDKYKKSAKCLLAIVCSNKVISLFCCPRIKFFISITMWYIIWYIIETFSRIATSR